MSTSITTKWKTQWRKCALLKYHITWSISNLQHPDNASVGHRTLISCIDKIAFTYALLLSHIVLTFKSVFRMLTAVNSYQNCPSFSRGGFRHLASIEICFVVIRLVSADLLSVFTNASDWPAPFKANDAFYLDVYLGAVHSSQSAGGNNKNSVNECACLHTRRALQRKIWYLQRQSYLS